MTYGLILVDVWCQMIYNWVPVNYTTWIELWSLICKLLYLTPRFITQCNKWWFLLLHEVYLAVSRWPVDQINKLKESLPSLITLISSLLEPVKLTYHCLLFHCLSLPVSRFWLLDRHHLILNILLNDVHWLESLLRYTVYPFLQYCGLTIFSWWTARMGVQWRLRSLWLLMPNSWWLLFFLWYFHMFYKI